MKKILFFCLVGLCSCTQNQVVSEVSDDEVKSVKVSFNPFEYDIDSRMVVTPDLQRLWELNDTIGIFPNEGGQVEFPITEETAGSSNAYFTGGGWALKANYTYSAYYPYNFYNRNPKAIPFSYEGQIQDGSDTRGHLSRYVFALADPQKVENGQISFALNHVGCLLHLTLTLPEARTYTSLDLYANDEVIPIKKTFNIISAGSPEEHKDFSNHLSVGLNNITTTEANQEVIVWVAFPTMNEAEKTLKAVLKDSQGNVYVGDVSRLNADNSGSFNFFLNLARRKAYKLKASPVLTDGFTGVISDWEKGVEISGVAE